MVVGVVTGPVVVDGPVPPRLAVTVPPVAPVLRQIPGRLFEEGVHPGCGPGGLDLGVGEGYTCIRGTKGTTRPGVEGLLGVGVLVETQSE